MSNVLTTPGGGLLLALVASWGFRSWPRVSGSWSPTGRGLARGEDAAQEALVKAWRYLDSYDGRGSFEGWLFRICRRCAFDVGARETSEQRRLAAAASETATHPLVMPSHASAVELGQLIEGLPQCEREAFVLTQVSELSYAETAEVLDIPIGTVRSRVARARRLRPPSSPGPRRRELRRRAGAPVRGSRRRAPGGRPQPSSGEAPRRRVPPLQCLRRGTRADRAAPPRRRHRDPEPGDRRPAAGLAAVLARRRRGALCPRRCPDAPRRRLAHAARGGPQRTSCATVPSPASSEWRCSASSTGPAGAVRSLPRAQASSSSRCWPPCPTSPSPVSCRPSRSSTSSEPSPSSSPCSRWTAPATVRRRRRPRSTRTR